MLRNPYKYSALRIRSLTRVFVLAYFAGRGLRVSNVMKDDSPFLSSFAKSVLNNRALRILNFQGFLVVRV